MRMRQGHSLTFRSHVTRDGCNKNHEGSGCLLLRATTEIRTRLEVGALCQALSSGKGWWYVLGSNDGDSVDMVVCL